MNGDSHLTDDGDSVGRINTCLELGTMHSYGIRSSKVKMKAIGDRWCKYNGMLTFLQFKQYLKYGN